MPWRKSDTSETSILLNIDKCCEAIWVSLPPAEVFAASHFIGILFVSSSVLTVAMALQM